MSKTRALGTPSIADVAQLAGVSAQTVSRVANASRHVSPTTRARVQRAMVELGYSPNRAARALRSGHFRLIGMLTQQIQRTGETLTAGGVIEAASNAGYSVCTIQVEHPEVDDVSGAVARLSHQAIDGLVIVQAGTASPEHLALPAGMPIAVSDSTLVGLHPSASADQVGGVRAAITHLLSLGHRTVHHVTGPRDSQSALAREAAWAETLQAADIAPPAPIDGDWSAHAGYAAGHQLAADPTVTAVFCANDEVAIGVMRALAEHGKRVPADVSVVGFDGIELAEFTTPPLTTVRQDFHAAGSAMVKLILEQVKYGLADGTRRLVLPTELVVRGSTAPPPPAA